MLIPHALTLMELTLCLGLLTFLNRSTSIVRNTLHHRHSVLAITFPLQGSPTDHQHPEHSQRRQH